MSLAVLVPMMLGGAVAARSGPAEDSLFRQLAVLGDVLGLVRQAYVEPADQGELMEGALAGSVEALDPFSLFVGREHVAEFEATYRRDHRYAGAQLLAERGLIFVSGVEDGSAADQAGIERGDLVAKVGGVSTRDLDPWQVWKPLAKGSGRVELELLRLGEAQLVEVDLAVASETPAVTVSRGDGAPVVRPHRLDSAALADLRAALESLAAENVTAIVLDLTGVFVGEPEEGWHAAALFVEGELGRLVARSATLAEQRSEGPRAFAGELVVAVDRGTQGAAEVLAAALDSAGHRLVGQPTFGWAGRGEVIDLPGGDRVVLTTAWFASPSGVELSKSLEPDVVVDDRARAAGEEEKPLSEVILRRALEELAAGPAAEEQELEAAA